MLKTLVKKQLMEIFRSWFYNSKKNKKRSVETVIAFGVLFVLLMVVVMGGMFTLLSFVLCEPFAEVGMGWFYFALMSLLAILLGAFGSVLNTYSSLYLAKDNDLLLSLPIPVQTIMTARLLSVYLMGLMYSAIVVIPAVIVYWAVVSVSPLEVLGGVLLVFLISVFVFILSCVLGWIVAKISLKLKHKSFVTVLASLLGIGAYYFFYFKAQSVLGEVVANALLYGQKIKKAAYPLYLVGRIGEGEVPAMLAVTAAMALLLLLTWICISRSFIGMITSSGRTVRIKYKERKAKEKGMFRALFGKEMRRFTASPNYMLNCGIGTLFLFGSGVFLVVKASWIRMAVESFPEEGGLLAAGAAGCICLVCAMNDMAAASVSLEGKNLWITQSLPILPQKMLLAKACVQLVLTELPTLFCCVCAWIAIRPSILQGCLMVLFPLLYVALLAFFDLFLNLKFPNLTWTSEIGPIKQSLPVTLGIFGGWIYVLLLFGGGYLILRYAVMCVELYLALVCVVTAVLAVILYRWVCRKGARVFAGL